MHVYEPLRTRLPTVSFEYALASGQVERSSAYNASKVALIVENRPVSVLAPVIIHFISVLPRDWTVRMLGSPVASRAVNQSAAIRAQVAVGKLRLDTLPDNVTIVDGESISHFLTSPWLYDTYLAEVEHVLVFQTDSMLCANAYDTVDSYLAYDWVGAPWPEVPDDEYGGNGGLSMRGVRAISRLLAETDRPVDGLPEDVWITQELSLRNHSMATVREERPFAAEMLGIDSSPPLEIVWSGRGPKPVNDRGYVAGVDDWRDGQYEPLGYHLGSSGAWLHGGVWGTPDYRRHLYTYCPELKIIVAEQGEPSHYVPGDCGANWKRSAPDADALMLMP
jgi:hypothetical protein